MYSTSGKGESLDDPERIGVTGGAGFIGSHLCERLLAEGREVVAVDDFSHGIAGNMAAFLSDPNFRFHELDCRDQRELRRVFAGCDAIAHLAADKIPRYGGALQHARGQRRGRARRLRRRAGARRAGDHHLDLRRVRQRHAAVRRGRPGRARPVDHAALGLRGLEALRRAHRARAMPRRRACGPTILRLFNVYGPRNHPILVGRPGHGVHRGAARRRDHGAARRRAPGALAHLRDRHGRRLRAGARHARGATARS